MGLSTYEQITKKTEKFFNINVRKFPSLLIPVVRLKSGAELSIQASELHYCTPRETLPTLNHYSCVEVNASGLGKCELFNLYVKDTDGIAAWLPIEALKVIIAAHGGIESFLFYDFDDLNLD